MRSIFQVCCLAAGLLAQPALGQNMTSYTVEFVATWSAQTHPQDFPINPHFSGLIGGTHNGAVSFWDVGGQASDGIEAMAERGRKSPLDEEVEAAIDAGTAEFLLSGGGISRSPGSVSLEFEISADYPLVTLVSMIAPSPDWFVGVHGLSLLEDGEWVDELEVPLFLYDAGTDSGTSYTSPNEDTDPAEEIQLMEEGPFATSGLVGTFTFSRVQVASREPTDLPSGVEISRPYPNPAAGFIQIDVGQSEIGLLDLAATEIRVLDALGRVTATKTADRPSAGSKIRIDVAHLPPGMYFVEARSRIAVERSSFVIAR